MYRCIFQKPQNLAKSAPEPSREDKGAGTLRKKPPVHLHNPTRLQQAERVQSAGGQFMMDADHPIIDDA